MWYTNFVPVFLVVFTLILKNEAVRLTIEEMAHQEGYKIETHEVTTEDDYILTLHRIPCSREGVAGSKVVLLQHGLLGSSEDFLLLKYSFGLAYFLADNGFDVWMGNNRGNCYSYKHKTYDSEMDKEYWNFNLDTMAEYDMPAIIEYVLHCTSRTSLSFVGYAQGSTLLVMTTILKPEYNDKIIFHVSAGAIIYLDYLSSPILLQLSEKYTTQRIDWTPFIGDYVFKPKKIFLDMQTDQSCFTGIGPQLCPIPRYAVEGFMPNPTQLMYDIEQYDGCTTSIYVVEQILQWYTSGEFQKYDYNVKKNLEMYGSVLPTGYDLSQVAHKILIIWSTGNWITHKPGHLKFYNSIPSAYRLPEYFVPTVFYSHTDYILSERNRNHIYPTIIEQLNANL